ncbi:uncharacterized protein LOC106012205 [Aplysia californica]|uniref:Uncharacterized protein LOC106012205 n=1 Tax=Aplysia californica TaxID=6500 RepID=A0ABM1A338_APLCA|nr:uncharacterized protein LOC106012205 [Aplysia californica]
MPLWTFLSSGVWSQASPRASCLHQCVRQTVRVCVLVCIISLLVEATPQFFSDEDVVDTGVSMPDKRPARLSYFRAPYSSSRGRYDSYGSRGYSHRSYGGYGKNDWWRKKAVNRYRMPWESLPNTNCLRKKCRSDGDCCRRHSKCNPQAHVCYDCWYGHPCRTNRDCCERFPYCNSVFNTCGK